MRERLDHATFSRRRGLRTTMIWRARVGRGKRIANAQEMADGEREYLPFA